MICSKCSKEITDDSKFCEFCGSKLRGKTEKNINVKQESSSWHLRLRNVILALIVPIGWITVFVNERGKFEDIPLLLLFIVLSNFAVWAVYKATLYVIYGSQKGSF